MSKNCGHTTPCGCGDTAIPSAPPCTTSGPCAGEPCAELFCEECIVHCQVGMTVDIGGNTFVIPEGARLDQILQLLFTHLDNPACTASVAHGLRLTGLTDTGVTINWTGDELLTYTIDWTDGVNPAGTVDVTGVSTYEIINLIPDTEYTISISTGLAPVCTSVTLTFTTL